MLDKQTVGARTLNAFKTNQDYRHADGLLLGLR